MRNLRGPHTLWKPPDSFAETYCVNCKAGWTRTGTNGSLTICLLDREPVLTGMTDCDRYEPREKEKPQALPSPPKKPAT